MIEQRAVNPNLLLDLQRAGGAGRRARDQAGRYQSRPARPGTHQPNHLDVDVAAACSF